LRSKLDGLKNATVIDVTGEPLEVLKKIAACETILSSSLHGLVIADSFHIPNLCILQGREVYDAPFKYEDYYSAYNKAWNPVDFAGLAMCTAKNTIIDRYQISPAEVLEKQKQLMRVFPFQ
jgi:hypothetical protein